MANVKSLQINRVELRNFRCFSQQTIEFDGPLILLEGRNGVGKTSLLEALYYACYLRSFRTHVPRELAHFPAHHFFIRVSFQHRFADQLFDHEIQVGFEEGNRRVKIDQKNVSSYKDLLQHYRVVSLTEQDVELITGSPQERRLFLDQVILLTQPAYLDTLRSYKSVIANRNALLQRNTFSASMYQIISEQLWELSKKIRAERVRVVLQFEHAITQIMDRWFHEVPWRIDLGYDYKKVEEVQDFASFIKKQPTIIDSEQRMHRSLIGAHLDDLVIRIKERHSRRFASRGEQKLIALLLKVAQLQELAATHGSAVFLLDDFVTDFDEERTVIFLDILQALDAQLIFTTPTKGLLYQHLQSRGAAISSLCY